MRIRHDTLDGHWGPKSPGKASDVASSQETRRPRPYAPSFEGGKPVYIEAPRRTACDDVLSAGSGRERLPDTAGH